MVAVRVFFSSLGSLGISCSSAKHDRNVMCMQKKKKKEREKEKKLADLKSCD